MKGPLKIENYSQPWSQKFKGYAMPQVGFHDSFHRIETYSHLFKAIFQLPIL